MNSMICWDCVLKHLSGALSYGKEILSGHTKGADLDHRVDFLGEMVNAEHHLELMDKEILNIVSNFRKEIQAKKGVVNSSDLEAIRKMYLKVEELSNSNNEVQIREAKAGFERDFRNLSYDNRETNRINITGDVSYPEYIENLDIVYNHVDNYEQFKYSYDSIRKYALNHGNIYVLESDIDLAEFELEIVNKTLYDFCMDERLSSDFLLSAQNMALLREYDVKQSFPTFSYKTTREMHETMKFLKNKGYQGHVYLWDNYKQQPVNKSTYIELMKDIESEFPLTVYYSLKEEEKSFNTQNIVCFIDRPVCCSTKTQLRSTVFVTWQDDKCFNSMKEHLNMIYPKN